MRKNLLEISKSTLRRFILGQQGLYPGRRWQGPEGVARAIRAGCVVQVDPLNVVARSHDIVLYGRVQSYRIDHLDRLLYSERAFFDYGGTVMIHPVEELPCWRVVMARKQREPRWQAFAAGHSTAIEAVRAAIRERGPLGTRDVSGSLVREGSFRSGKDTGQALYYLWLGGELMTHSRRNFDRLYDLRERIVPPHLDYVASPEEAEQYFARRVLRQVGITTQRGWRSSFAGTVERKVEPAEATERLEALLDSGEILQVGLEDDPRTARFLLAADFPLLEALHAGMLPEAWQPVDTTTEQEMVFLAPLEIVSARGRALPLFGFEYIWEVYKPAEKRRWGYYTMPILYGDRLVARMDPKLDRASNTLVIKGFWLEPDVVLDQLFARALVAAINRFMRFIGAETLEFAASAVPAQVSGLIKPLKASPGLNSLP